MSDFVCISSASLQMVVEDERLMSAWMGLLVNSKAELMTAVLHGLAVVISQPDEKYVDNAAAGAGSLSVLTFAAGTIGTLLSTACSSTTCCIYRSQVFQ